MTDATLWLRSQGKKAILGEWAGANNTDCHTGVESMLQFLSENNDVWEGWLWWAAGPWWGPYMYSVEPNPPCAGRDKPQEAWIAPYLGQKEAMPERMGAFQHLVDSASPEEAKAFRAYLDSASRSFP